MSPDLAVAAAFAIAAIATYLATPVAIAIAVRTKFFDHPAGYKGHQAPTPYLGGTAIIIGIIASVVLVRGTASTHWTIIAGAVAIWAMGTIDDRISLPISVRTLAEAGIAVMLWETGRGWGVFHADIPDLALTIIWVVGVMNAFNLMDNMDGAATTTAAVSAIGAGVLALISGDTALAALSFAVAGACFGFLPRNLARPARIFLGDGGSLLLGLLVARVTMAAVTPGYLGPSGVIVAALLVGMVILDTTLVTISRSRAGRPVLSGGRDHLTHRLSHRLGSPRNVALTLAVTQLLVCSVTIGVAQAGAGWVVLTGAFGAVTGAVLIWQFESSGRFKPLEVEPPPEVTAFAAGRGVALEAAARGVALEPVGLPARVVVAERASPTGSALD